MSNSLIGGAVGIALSFATGGAFSPAMGWMVGSLAGGLLLPSGAEGPRLSDLKPQASEYGRPIPKLFSIFPVGGNAIWAAEYIEEEDDSKEGTTFRYYANFAVLISESDGTRALGKIWAGPEKRLVYDSSGTGELEGGGELRFYNGASDQLPDPLIEAYEGVGNVSAWRGYAYVVFERFPLEKDGNQIPFLTIETGKAGDSAPESLGLVWWGTPLVGEQYILAPYYGSYRGVIVRNAADFTFEANRSITFPESGNDDMHVLDEDRGVFIRMPQNALSYRVVDILTGADSQHTLTGVVAGDIVHGIVYHNGSYIFAVRIAATGDTKIVLVDPATNTVTSSYTFTEAGGELLTGPCLRTAEGANFVICATTTKIRRYDLDGSTASVDLGAKARTATTLATNAVRVDPSTGLIWSVAKRGAESTLYVNVTHATSGLLLANTVTTTLIREVSGDPLLFVPGDAGIGRPDRVYVAGNKGGTYTDYYEEFDAAAGGYIGGYEGSYHGINDLQAAFYVAALEKLVGIRYGGGNYGMSTTLDPTTIPLSTGYMGGADSSLNKETLAEVVAELSRCAGLEAAQYDVTALTDTVDGYGLLNQTTVREAIRALMPVYYFDGVESCSKNKFVKRGGAAAAVIADAELGARESGTERQEPFPVVRGTEEELPRNVVVKYLLRANDYAVATKSTRRLTGYSGDESVLELQMVLSDQKAQEVADVTMYTAHVERRTHKVSLPLKYSHLEPTDVIEGKGKRLRLKTMKERRGYFECEAVADDASVYSPAVVVTETTQIDNEVADPSLTRLELM